MGRQDKKIRILLFSQPEHFICIRHANYQLTMAVGTTSKVQRSTYGRAWLTNN